MVKVEGVTYFYCRDRPHIDKYENDREFIMTRFKIRGPFVGQNPEKNQFFKFFKSTRGPSRNLFLIEYQMNRLPSYNKWYFKY